MLRWLCIPVLFLMANPAWAATGGPDTVGYRWADSDEQGGPSIDEWNDAWTQGNAIITVDDRVVTDDERVPNQVTDLRFDFEFYGDTYTAVNICSNGFIYFGDGGQSPERRYGGSRLPDNNPPDGVIAPFWTDWNPGTGGGQSGVFVYSTAEEYVVVWRSPYFSRQFMNEAAVRLTPDGEITFFYRVVSTDLPDQNLSIGIESASNGTDGLDYYFGRLTRNEGFGDTIEDFAVRFWWEPLAHAPEITPIGDKVLNVGAVLQFSVEASDQDGDTVTLGVANLPNGASFNPQSGLFRWQPTEGQEGEHQVTFTATDDGNPRRSDEETITITVSRINLPPQITSTPITTATSGQQYVYDVDAIDPDGDVLRYRLARNGSPEGATINQVTGVVTWTPGPGLSGEIVSFRVIVDDDNGGLQLHTWEVGVDDAPPVNNPPMITSTPPTVAIVGQQLVYQVIATDPDGHAITFGTNRCPQGANIDRETGRFTWTPSNGDLGEQVTCIVTVRDSEGMLGNAQSMSIAVQAEPPPQNELPVFTTQPPLTATVGGTYQYAANANDPEGTPIRYFFTSAPAGAFVGVNTGVVQWEPNQTHLGSQQSFTLVAEDGGGLRAEQRWTVSVSEDLNRAPIVTSTPPIEAFAGEEYLYQVLATDPDGDAMSFELDAIRSPHDAAMTEAGRLTWTPGQSLVGQIVGFRVVVIDINGAETFHDFSVRISEPGPENRNPVITSAPETEAMVGEQYTYTVTATDPDGDSLNLEVVSLPDGAQRLGSSFSWTPGESQVGPNSFSIRVTDGQGGSAVQDWIVVVSAEPPNNPPVFTSTPGNQAIAGELYEDNVTWNDPDGHTVTFRMVSGPAGMQASPDGGLAWTPSEEQVGVQVAIFEIRDSEGATTRQEVEITVSSGSQNRAPVITSQAPGQGTVGQAYTYRPTATDADGDDVTFVLTQAPPGASFVQGAVAWVPAENQGDQNLDFTLRASDGNGGTTEQSWVVRVSANVGNRAPVITSDAVTAATVGQLYTYQVTATDPDGDRIFYLLPPDENPPAGMQMDGDSGVLTWTPTQDQAGESHRVVVVVADEGGLWDAQVFQVGVGVPANQGPSITSQAPGTAQVQQQYVYQVIATDPEGETLRFFTDPDNCPAGASIHVLTGRFTWTPALTDAGSRITCVIGVVDPVDNVDVQQISIQVDGEAENRDPVISSQPSTSATQASPYVYNITASDADGDELIYTLVEGPNGARITTRGPLNGVIWLVPAGSEGESFEFEVRVSDGNGGLDSQQWTVTVEGGEPNQPPIITSTPGASGSPGVVYQYQVQAFDLEREELTYTLEASPAGASISENGNITWTPTEGQGGQAHAFRLVVTDPRGGEARQNWSVQVTGEPPPPINNPPVITSEPNTEASVGQGYSYALEANDPDGDPLFWILPDDQNPPDGMTINASTGEINWTPTEAGRFRVTAAVTDGTAWAAQIFEISVDAGEANQPPAFTSSPPTQATAGEQLVYQATAEDPDGDTIRFLLMEDNCTAGITINSVTGQLLYTPPLAMIGSTASCVLVAQDTNGLANTQSLSIQVTDGSEANRAPRITSVPLELALVDQQYTYTARAEDEDGDTLGWVLTSGPQGAFLNATSGELTWTPVAEDLGSNISFAIEVRDGRGGVHRQQWDVRVDEGDVNNEAPVITSTPATTARVGQSYGYAPVAVDPDEDELTWRLLESPQGATINAETGSLNWLPIGIFENDDVVFQVEVSDGNDNARQRWTVHVDPQIGGNNPPSILTTPSTQVFLGDDYRVTMSASDPDSDTLSWRLIAAPNGTALSSSGALVWSPNLGDLGQSYDFSVEVSDGRGGSDSLVWQVTVPNRVPEITSDAALQAAVGQAYSYRVSAQDEDTGQPISYRITSRAPVGMTINPTTGQISWIPSDDQGGEVFTLVVRAEDSLGAFDEQSFQIGVEAPVDNRAPVITGSAPDSATATELYTHDFEATDEDDDELTWRLESGPPGMTIDSDSGVLRWTPSMAQVGETLNYVVIVEDEQGLFDRRTVMVLVEVEANRPPEFGNEPETTGVVGVTYEFAPRVSDEDGDPVSVQLVAGPPSAECSDGRCNQLTWTPDAAGAYAFHLIATDDRGAEVELRWSVIVEDPAANREPSFTTSPVTEAQVDEEYIYVVSASDPDGDNLVYSLSTLSPAMMAIDAQTGEITWTPTIDDVGSHTVVVQVSDGRGGSDLQSYTLEVIDDDVNRPPVVTSEPLTVAVVETLYEYRVRAYDPDEGDTLSFSLKTGPGGMELSDEGVVTWTPSFEAGGQAVMVQVEVSDGEATVVQDWIIEVEENEDIEPIAHAGLDRTVDPGVIELDGSASSDPLARGLDYAWSFVEGPSDAVIDDPSLEVATVELLHPGDYRFKLAVTASGGRSAEDEVVITVRYGGPIAIAGDDQRVELSPTGDPVAVTLAGEAIVLEEDTPIYAWSQMSGPPVELNLSDTATPEFKAQDPGVYMFELTVSDSETTSLPDVVVISVVEPDENSAANWGSNESACGCAGSPFGDVAWLLFALPALRRRRRLA